MVLAERSAHSSHRDEFEVFKFWLGKPICPGSSVSGNRKLGDQFDGYKGGTLKFSNIASVLDLRIAPCSKDIFSNLNWKKLLECSNSLLFTATSEITIHEQNSVSEDDLSTSQ